MRFTLVSVGQHYFICISSKVVIGGILGLCSAVLTSSTSLVCCIEFCLILKIEATHSKI